MVGVRLAIALVALGVVSAHDLTLSQQLASFGEAIFEKAMKLLGLGQIHLFENADEGSRQNWYGQGMHHGWHHDGEHHHGDHHKHWHDKMHKQMKEAHACHEKCAEVDEEAKCHANCPKPWAPFVKACQDFPAIKVCHTTCKGTDCGKCPKFEVDWMNKLFANSPERAMKKAEAKCPMVLKAHACHKACAAGDRDCHHKCHSFHGHGDWHHHGHHHGGHHDHHHKDWHHHHGHHHGEHDHHHHKDWHHHHGHHHGDDHKHWHEKMHKMMQEARACHEKCGTDAECHSKCPKPWAPFVKACQDFPAIKACHATCKDADCSKCQKFEVDWMNKKFAKNPEHAIKKAEAKCPMLLKAHACHKACAVGDQECHLKCHSFHGHGDWHHHGDHDHKDWHHHGHHHGERGDDDDHEHWHKKMHKEMQEAHACHEKCGTDAECHSKCPKPWAPFVKACQDFPAIKACHQGVPVPCKDADCSNCPKFEVDWMNKKFAEKPEHAIKKAEAKCPMLLKAHACHKACALGDMDCHSKCHSIHGHGDWHHHDHHHKDWHHHGHHHGEHADDDDHEDKHHHGDDDDHHHHGDDDEHEHGDDDDHHHHGHHHGDDHKHWHKKMHKEMQEAHACHEKCGTDAECHSKCPKPWAPFLKACKAWPVIKACHTTCKDVECHKCAKFDEEWMNKKFAKSPGRFAWMAEAKCPMLEKAHACHKACSLGDKECHHKCHKEFHGHHGEHWNIAKTMAVSITKTIASIAKTFTKKHHGEHHEDHREHWNKMHKFMEKAHACHKACGKDAECHSKCPKPWAPFVKACQDFPAIKACRTTCKDADCDKCPKFDMVWINKKFAKNPERVMKMAEAKCPTILKAHACHAACSHGDHECHRQCPSMFHGHHHCGHPHGQEEKQNEPTPEESEQDRQDPILV